MSKKSRKNFHFSFLTQQPKKGIKERSHCKRRLMRKKAKNQPLNEHNKKLTWTAKQRQYRKNTRIDCVWSCFLGGLIICFFLSFSCFIFLSLFLKTTTTTFIIFFIQSDLEKKKIKKFYLESSKNRKENWGKRDYNRGEMRNE